MPFSFSLMSRKRLPIKESVSVIVFSLVLCLSILAVRPTLKVLNERMNIYVASLFGQVENTLGIKISYGSLSPSILSGIRVKNISIKEPDDGENILDIKNVSIRYSFPKLLRRKFPDMFKDITVEGVTLSFDGENDFLLVEKIKRLFSFSSDSKKNPKETEDKPDDFSLKNLIQLKSLFDIYIKNLRISYSIGSDTADAFFKRISMNILEKTGQVSLNTSGSLIYYNGEKEKSLSCGFVAEGAVEEKLDGSSLHLNISNFTDGNFNFKRLNLLFGYADDVASFTTVQNSYPFVFAGSLDIEKKRADVSLRAFELTLGNLISSKKSGKILNALDNITMTLEAKASCDIKSRSVDYSSNGNIALKDGLFKGGEKIEYSFFGNEKKIAVEKLDLKGNRLNCDFSGDLAFKDLQLSGNLNLYNYTLLNGGEISTEVFFEPEKKGFMAFSPQLMFGEKSFTALQLELAPSDDSVDFSFELSDYAHSDYGKPGTVALSGSYLGGSKYIQANLSAEDMFLDSVMDFALFFSDGKKTSPSFLKPYLFNGELYVSSDFKTLSYNIPYLLVANSEKDGKFVYASIDGNDTSLSVSRVDFISGGKFSNLSAQVELSPDYKEAFFTVDATRDSVPYHLAGTYMGKSLSVTGDYGFSLELRNAFPHRYDGTFSMESFPVSFVDSIFSVSMDSGFTYSKEDGVNLIVTRFEAEEGGAKFSFRPRLILSGSVTKYGAIFDNITYSDRFSALEGPLSLAWNINDGSFSGATLDFSLKNQISSEGFDITAEITNPGGKQIDSNTLKSDLYLNSKIEVNRFALSRFLSEASDNNQATGTVVVSGTLESPYIGANIDSLKLLVAGNVFSASGKGYGEGKNLFIEDMNISYNGIEFKGLKAEYDIGKFSGKASGVLESGVLSKSIIIPMELSMESFAFSEKNSFPTDFDIVLDIKKASGSFLTKELSERISLVHSSGNTAVNTSDFLGISGFIAKNGDMDFSIAKGKSVSASVSGNIFSKNLDININDVTADLASAASYLNIPDFKIYKGIMKGNMTIKGLKKDPDFGGRFSVSGADITLPQIVPSHITAPRLEVRLNQNVISVPEFKGMVKKTNPVYGKIDFFFDRWFFDRMEAKIRTPENAHIPANLKLALIQAKGDVALDLNLTIQDRYLDLGGAISLKKTNAKIVTTDFFSLNQNSEPSFFFRSDLDVYIEQHVSFNFDPILRTVFVPDKKFTFKCDTEDGMFNIDGDIQLRSGDIAYLNRSFYLKNGLLRFDPNETRLNPYITLTAETREKDAYGNDVRIILSANNQELDKFQPVFTSIPPKSEMEIRELLGQIATGDSDKVTNLLIATSDYAIQSTIGRTVENTLREYLNFDIFSLRTNVLQNAIKQTLSSNSENMKIGNYLDNSTVYIGKYFGSSLYADALMHLSYDDSILGNEGKVEGFSFQPEIGFEMDISQMFAPLWNVFLPKIGLKPTTTVANVRLSLSPEIGRGLDSIDFATSTSVTLSWKFSF